MEKKKANYPLAITMQVATLLAPCVSGFFVLYTKFESKEITTIDAMGNRTTEIVKADWNILLIVLTIILFVVFLFTKQPLKNYTQQAIQDNEYDENGVSKKKKFENLTRQEREAMDLQKASQMESLLSSSEIKKIIKKGSENPEQDLRELIGIFGVKQKVEEFMARAKFEAEEKAIIRKEKGKKAVEEYIAKKSSLGGRHSCFYGSAGTGKTTVARIMTGIMYKYGIIKENKCVEVDGNFLKAGEYSATKTKLIINQSYGGVLFIDEAYTIIDGSGGYGREVIATLIKEMEDNRDKFVVIIAGYKNDMKRLLDSNEGFKSRIKEYINFEDYTIDEMGDIFRYMAEKQQYCISDEAYNNFMIRAGKEKRLSSFGNARTVRNILDEAIDKHTLNYSKGLCERTNADGSVIPNAENRYILCGCDVSTAINTNVL